VAFEVAKALGAPLDVLLVRKLGVPFHPELAFGAIGDGGVRVISEAVVREAGLGEREMAAVESKERAELQRRAERFRGDHRPISLKGRIAVIVDDGIATGATARAACQVAHAQKAAKVVLAIPIGATDTAKQFAECADEVVVLHNRCRISPSARDTTTLRRPRTTRWWHYSTAPAAVFVRLLSPAPTIRRRATRRSG